MYIPRANGNCESESAMERPTATEKRQLQASEAACCRCNGHQEREPRSLQSKRPLEFSAEMLKDQELLVSTLSQQGISEALIRRQFNKLLEEQSKQLARQRESSRTAEEPSSNGAGYGRERERAPAVVRDVGDPRGEALEPRRASATSLLKQRIKREQQDFRSRNNGLQDLVTAAQIIDKSKSHPDSKSTVGSRFRLNGTQDKGAPESEAFCRAHSLRHPSELPAAACGARRNVSSNGLENSRKPAAATAATCLGSAKSPGEPAQYSSGGGDHPTCCSTADTDTRADNNHNIMNNDQSGAQAQYSANHLASSPQQFTDIQEPRVFGGFTYFARKPQSIPQFACNSHQHPQPPSASDQLQNSQLSATHPVKCQRKSACAS